jgi:hypothetical protein
VDATVAKVKKYDRNTIAAMSVGDSLYNVLAGDSIVLTSAAAFYDNATVSKNKLITARYTAGGDPAKLRHYATAWVDTVHRNGEIIAPDRTNPDSSAFWECPGGGGCDTSSLCGKGVPNINCPEDSTYYLPGGGGDTSYCGSLGNSCGVSIPNINCPDYWGYDKPGGGGADD